MIVRCGRCGATYSGAGRAPRCPRCMARAPQGRMCGIAHMLGGDAACPDGGCALFRELGGAAEGPGEPCLVETFVGSGPGAPAIAATLDALRRDLQRSEGARAPVRAARRHRAGGAP